MMQRRYLNVPYAEKSEVKKLGGMWDADTKLWWVPMHVPLKSVQRWVFKKPFLFKKGT
jgi:hypothetical protein